MTILFYVYVYLYGIASGGGSVVSNREVMFVAMVIVKAIGRWCWWPWWHWRQWGGSIGGHGSGGFSWEVVLVAMVVVQA